jgi:plastocyanin
MNSQANQADSRTPRPLQPASRWVLTVASVFALALGACSSASSSATLAPASQSPSTPATTPSATIPVPASAPAPASASASASAAASGGAAGSGASLQLSAQGIQYSTKELKAPAGKAFSIKFANNDSGISHNVEILDANDTSIFKGAIFPGVATQTYQVPALKAGTYSFKCDVHPSLMTGTLTVG